MAVLMTSNHSEFWDRRFQTEGAIWGESPSSTAQRAVGYLPAQARVLEVGFGYGRDLAFLLRHGFRVSGIDLSREGRRRAEHRLRQEGLWPETLVTGRFEEHPFPAGAFDALLSHRMAHLLVTPEAVTRFAEEAARVLRPAGLLCLGARDPRDLERPVGLVPVVNQVYEYADRPGHQIHYCWDEAAFEQTFGNAFEILSLTTTTELESAERPVPCHVTILIARKRHAPREDTDSSSAP